MKSSNIFFRIFYILSSAVIFICAFYTYHITKIGLYTLNIKDSEELSKLAHLGHYLDGTAGVLVAIAGISAVFIAFIAQRQEIRLQKDEIKKNSERDYIQRFENTFFQLLKNYNDIVDNIELNSITGSTKRGRECFSKMYEKLCDYYDILNKSMKGSPPEQIINCAYLEFNKEYKNIIGHYFRNLYNIVKFINQSEVSNKKFYTTILRAQLSKHETALLFYNSLSECGIDKFKPLVKYYNLIKNISDVLIDERHLKLYC